MSFFSSPPINMAHRGQGALAVRVGADGATVVECPATGLGAASAIVGAAVIGAAAYYFGKSIGQIDEERAHLERFDFDHGAREQKLNKDDLLAGRILVPR